jgi:hypothetical protein
VDPQDLRAFEYAPHPIRAALATWRQALRPKRFWGRQNLEMKPNTRRLRRLLGFVLFFYIGVCTLTFALHLTSRGYGLPPADAAALAFAVCLPLTTAVMLPCFGPTLKRFRIRRDQLLRIVAYGQSGIFWSSVLCLGLVGLVWGFNLYLSRWGGGTGGRGSVLSAELFVKWIARPVLYRFSGISEAASATSGAVFTLFQTVWWWPFLWRALRGYLRFEKREALALFVSTQLIGVLIIAILAIRYTSFGIWLVRHVWPIR